MMWNVVNPAINHSWKHHMVYHPCIIELPTWNDLISIVVFETTTFFAVVVYMTTQEKKWNMNWTEKSGHNYNTMCCRSTVSGAGRTRTWFARYPWHSTFARPERSLVPPDKPPAYKACLDTGDTAIGWPLIATAPWGFRSFHSPPHWK